MRKGAEREREKTRRRRSKEEKLIDYPIG